MNYVGIDLGTTNSAICSYDGEQVRLYKSPEQHDVTPSVLFVDKRGNRYVGARAYNNAARNPGSAAALFKRLMGSSTPVRLAAADLTLTPEECSSEVLKALFGYLPEAIRNSSETGTVITVPAAFNQMQKDATMVAAESASLGRVALMQEPVAAVMSVMRSRSGDGRFLVFDLGGGTLDIAVAEATSGRVSLLAHGGIEMCGGRDFDLSLFREVVVPWLRSRFALPDDFETSDRFRVLVRMGIWACERAKIELSQRADVVVAVAETEIGVQDSDGNDIYIDVPLTRQSFDVLIAPKVLESVEATRRALAKAGFSPDDIERIVFVGGPTQYGPLRERVATELGIAASTDVNPMTAVAEGAAVFAESIDWSSTSRGRKNARGALAVGPAGIRLDYLERTPDTRTRVVVRVVGAVPQGAAFQLDSLDTGWSSGRMDLQDGRAIEVALPRQGANTFKVFVFDGHGGAVSLDQERVLITRTAATIDAIPASHSIGLEVRSKVGGRTRMHYLVREGDPLPKKGRLLLKAEESLKAGSGGSLNFQLWEGEVDDAPSENLHIGCFRLSGSHFESGVIPAGAELVCDYEVLDSGNVKLEVTVPSLGAAFPSRNFYSPGQVDFSSFAGQVGQQAATISSRLDEISARVDDARLDAARERLERASRIAPQETDPEKAKQSRDDLQEARRLVAETRKAHLKAIRQMELDKTLSFFDEHVKEFARPTEDTAFMNLSRTARRAIESGNADFEAHLEELRGRNFQILWRQDWWVVDRFGWMKMRPDLFADARAVAELVRAGDEALAADDISRLRQIVALLDSSRLYNVGADDMAAPTNIVLT